MAKRRITVKEQYPPSKKYRYILVSRPDMVELQEFPNFRQACDFGQHNFGAYGVLYVVIKKPKKVEPPPVDERDTYLPARPPQGVRIYR